MKAHRFSVKYINAVIVLLTLIGFGNAWAGSLTVTNTWTPGQTLNAADLNQNFSDTKTAVDDNNSRITNIENQTRNLVTGCPAGQAIQSIATNGAITCHTDLNTTYLPGAGIDISGTTISAKIGANITIEPTITAIPTSDLTIKEVANVTISAPSSGYVLVTHSGYVVLFGEPNNIYVGVGDTNSAIDTKVVIGHLDTTSSNRFELPYSVTQIYNVASAGNYTYYGLAQKNSTFNAGSINVVPQSLSAIFIPNLY